MIIDFTVIINFMVIITAKAFYYQKNLNLILLLIVIKKIIIMSNAAIIINLIVTPKFEFLIDYFNLYLSLKFTYNHFAAIVIFNFFSMINLVFRNLFIVVIVIILINSMD